MEQFLTQFAKIFPELNLALGTGIMVFARMLGLFRFAPVLSAKFIPAMAKIPLALILTIICVLILKPQAIPDKTSLFLGLLLNFTFGAIIGFIANCIISAISAGGDMINTQMGLSSAMVLDPTKGAQTSLLGTFFSYLAFYIFMCIGGLYWIINAFLKSFTIFPIYANSFSLEAIINMDYLIQITSNVLFMGMQIAAPVLLATLGQDIILGIISKTAPQVNVFQLSFLFKPIMGSLILMWILPMLVNTINEYISSYAQIF